MTRRVDTSRTFVLVAESGIRAALRTLSRKGCGFESHRGHYIKVRDGKTPWGFESHPSAPGERKEVGDVMELKIEGKGGSMFRSIVFLAEQSKLKHSPYVR